MSFYGQLLKRDSLLSNRKNQIHSLVSIYLRYPHISHNFSRIINPNVPRQYEVHFDNPYGFLAFCKNNTKSFLTYPNQKNQSEENVVVNQPSKETLSKNIPDKHVHDNDNDDVDDPPLDHGEIYEAPFSNAVRRIKILSLTSLIFTSTGGPLLAIADPAPSKIAIAVLFVAFGGCTTGLLHWFAKPYVNSLYLSEDKKFLSIETTSFWGKPKTITTPVEDVKPPKNTMRPLVSFKVGENYYYIHKEMFENKQLLLELFPWEDPQTQDIEQEIEENPQQDDDHTDEKQNNTHSENPPKKK